MAQIAARDTAERSARTPPRAPRRPRGTLLPTHLSFLSKACTKPPQLAKRALIRYFSEQTLSEEGAAVFLGSHSLLPQCAGPRNIRRRWWAWVLTHWSSILTSGTQSFKPALARGCRKRSAPAQRSENSKASPPDKPSPRRCSCPAHVQLGVRWSWSGRTEGCIDLQPG